MHSVKNRENRFPFIKTAPLFRVVIYPVKREKLFVFLSEVTVALNKIVGVSRVRMHLELRQFLAIAGFVILF